MVVTDKLRAALPHGRYLLSTASWHVGMFGEGAYANAKPTSIFTGVNLAMAKSPAGQQLDLINIMAYDAGGPTTTGFDWRQSYDAHRAIWKTQALAVGIEIPPEAWGGFVVDLPGVAERARYVQSRNPGNASGTMLWSLQKPGSPSAQEVLSVVCNTYGLPSCSTPLPYAA